MKFSDFGCSFGNPLLDNNRARGTDSTELFQQPFRISAAVELKIQIVPKDSIASDELV